MTDPTAATTPRRLVLVRHAKSDQHVEPPVDDHDRPLNGRGRRDAPAMGRWVLREVGPPDLVLCSSALRAQQTWQLAADQLLDAPALQVRPELYGASPGQVLALVRAVGDGARTVVVVGHEPVQSALTRALAGPGSRPTALTGLAAGFSTSAVAVLELDGSWASLDPLGARLVGFGVPRG